MHIKCNKRSFKTDFSDEVKGPKTYHPVDPDKVFRLLGPRRQLHITNHGPVLPHPQMVAVAVDEHLREVVELRNQLLCFERGRKRDVQGFTGFHLRDAVFPVSLANNTSECKR